jgi:hypothetical protein
MLAPEEQQALVAPVALYPDVAGRLAGRARAFRDHDIRRQPPGQGIRERPRARDCKVEATKVYDPDGTWSRVTD